MKSFFTFAVLRSADDKKSFAGCSSQVALVCDSELWSLRQFVRKTRQGLGLAWDKSNVYNIINKVSDAEGIPLRASFTSTSSAAIKKDLSAPSRVCCSMKNAADEPVGVVANEAN